MQVNVNDLVSLIDILKNSIKETFDESINIENEDYYWRVPLDELYDPLKDPTLTIGQLSEDWEELIEVVKNRRDPLSYDLVRLGEMLKIIEKYSAGKWLIK